jgi:hypothetical protein
MCKCVLLAHRRNLEESHLGRARLAQYLFEQIRLVLWKETKIWGIEKNSVYGEYKEAAHVLYLQNPISLNSIEISIVCYSLISTELSNNTFDPMKILNFLNRCFSDVRNFQYVFCDSVFCVCGQINMSSWVFFMILICGSVQALFFKSCDWLFIFV